MARILKEDGGSLLLEDGSYLLNEAATPPTALDCAFLDAGPDVFGSVVERVVPVLTVPLLDRLAPQRMFAEVPTDFWSANVTVAHRFAAMRAGVVTHLRYYHATTACANGTSHTLSLWTDDGTKVASVVDAHPDGTAGGYREVALATPYVMSAGVTYRVSCSFSGGQWYSYRSGVWYLGDLASDLDTATGSTVGQWSNGFDVFPTTFGGDYYYIDVVFVPDPLPSLFAPRATPKMVVPLLVENFPLSFPGSGRLVLSNVPVNQLSPVFTIGPGAVVRVIYTQGLNDAGNVGVINVDDVSGAGSENKYQNSPVTGVEYVFAFDAAKSRNVIVYSYNNTPYRPGLTGAGYYSAEAGLSRVLYPPVAAQVAAGLVTLLPSLLDAGPALYSAVLVGGGATALVVALLDSARGVYAPSAVQVSALQALQFTGPLTSAPTVYAPSASVLPVAAAVGFLDAGRALSAPSASAIGVGQPLSVPLLTSASALSAPTAAQYSALQGLTTPLLFTNPDVVSPHLSTLYAQTVPFLVSTNGTYAPAIDRARYLLAPLCFTSPDVFAPTVIDGRSALGDALLVATTKQEFWPRKNTNNRVWPLPYRRGG